MWWKITAGTLWKGGSSRNPRIMSREATLGEFEKRIELPEYDSKEYAPGDIPDGLGEHLYEIHGTEVAVEFPSPKTEGNWVFENQGYAGRIELPDGWSLLLEPKVSLKNLFGMLEYAYDLDSARFLEGTYDAGSIEGFFDRVVRILAQNVIRRSNEGFFKEYVERKESSTFVRGKLDIQKTAREPWKPEVHQRVRELTADIEDNQIILWTLSKVLSNDLCRDDTRTIVRHAYRALEPITSLQEFTASDCTGRNYRRLNSDYEFMHALCRMILDNTGPTRDLGRNQMIPFVVEMPTLYERFVARWLSTHLSGDYRVESQKTVRLDDGTGLSFDIDLVFRRPDGDVAAIADTKYKNQTKPKPEDVAQVVAYAERMGTENAFLVYPTELGTDVDFYVGDTRVRDLHFELDDDLDANGERFLSQIRSGLESTGPAIRSIV